MVHTTETAPSRPLRPPLNLGDSAPWLRGRLFFAHTRPIQGEHHIHEQWAVSDRRLPPDTKDAPVCMYGVRDRADALGKRKRPHPGTLWKSYTCQVCGPAAEQPSTVRDRVRRWAGSSWTPGHGITGVYRDQLSVTDL